MTIKILTPTSKKSTTLTLPQEIFAAVDNPALITQAIRVFLSRSRQGTKAVKTRGDLNRSGRKIYRQKGTGHARHGDRCAPLFVGGGISHGPKGIEHYQLHLPRTMRRQATIAALTAKNKAKQVFVVDGLDSLKPKTQILTAALVKMLGADSMSQTMTLVLAKSLPNLNRSAHNLPNLTLILAPQLTAYSVLRSQKLLLTKDSLDVLKTTLLKK